MAPQIMYELYESVNGNWGPTHYRSGSLDDCKSYGHVATNGCDVVIAQGNQVVYSSHGALGRSASEAVADSWRRWKRAKNALLVEEVE